MTTTLNDHQATLPAGGILARGPVPQSFLDAIMAGLAPWQNDVLGPFLTPPSGIDDVQIRRDQLAATSALTTCRIRLRDELAEDLDGLRQHCDESLQGIRALADYYERLELDHAHYMWAFYTPGLTEADVLTYCAAILTDLACLVARIPADAGDLIPGVRLDAAHQAQAALQGWTDRTATTGATP